MILNLTPHLIRIYGFDVPDRFALGAHEPQWLIEPSGTVARIGEIELGTQHIGGMPVAYIEYSRTNGLPDHTEGTWCVVSLALALALPKRPDLLVPWREIRNPEGTTIGCRLLARPV